MRFKIGFVIFRRFPLKGKGFSIAELLIAIAISVLMLAIMSSLFFTSSQVFNQVRTISDVKENARLGVMQLEWLFQRWGTATPCTNASICTQVVSCGTPPDDFDYPPESSLCITIQEGNPCDEVWFYANLYGLGFVDKLIGPDRVAVMSCRLSSREEINFYHIKRGGLWAPYDWDYSSYPYPPIVRIRNLDDNNADCVYVSGTSNTEMDREVEILNGLYYGSNIFQLDGGDLLLRVPHRIHLYCAPNASDNNRLWLYMEVKDVVCEAVDEDYQPDKCDINDGTDVKPLVPVNEFRVENIGNAIRVTVTYTEEEGRTFTLERIYGR